MPGFQNGELLPKSQVFEKEGTMSAKDSKNRSREEFDDVCHSQRLSQCASEWQLSLLLKSKADGVLANDRDSYFLAARFTAK
jgi:hypothetical protein